AAQPSPQKDAAGMKVVVHRIDKSGLRLDVKFIHVEPAAPIVCRRVHPVSLRPAARKAQLKWNDLALTELFLISGEPDGERNVWRVLRLPFAALRVKFAFLLCLSRCFGLRLGCADDSSSGERR